MVRADLRVGFVAGALAAVPLVGLLSLASQLSGVSFLPFNLADLLIEATPGQLATNAIETLGGVAKLMAQSGGIVAFVGLAGLLGSVFALWLRYQRLQSWTTAGFVWGLPTFSLLVLLHGY